MPPTEFFIFVIAGAISFAIFAWLSPKTPDLGIGGWALLLLATVAILTLAIVLAAAITNHFEQLSATKPLSNISGVDRSDQTTPSEKIIRDVWFYDAVFYRVNGRWPKDGEALFEENLPSEGTKSWEQRIRETPTFKAVEKLLPELRQAARDDTLSVWGVRDPSKILHGQEGVNDRTFDPVEAQHWSSHRVYPTWMLFKPWHVHTLRDENDPGNADCYGALMVSRTQVERLWPSHSPRKDIEIMYENECNDDRYETLFKRSVFPLPSGKPFTERFSHHKFYIGVRNPSRNRTLGRVNLRVLSVGGVGPTWPTEISLSCPRVGGMYVDIPPMATEYFLLGEANDASDRGMFHPAIMSDSEYATALAAYDKTIGFRILGTESSFPLLKNNGYRIELTAYADNVVPASIVATVNAREKLEVLIDVPR